MARATLLGSLLLAAATTVTAACGGSTTVKSSTATTAKASVATTSKSAGSSPGTGRSNSGQTTGGTAAGTITIDPCTLLTDDDVKAGFALSDVHAPVTSVTRAKNDAPGSSSCQYSWSASDGESSNFAIYVYDPTVIQMIKSGGGSEAVPELPGAYKNSDGYFVGTRKATVSITGLASTPASLALLKAAAAKAG